MEFSQSEGEAFLRKITELTEANLSNEQIGVSELAREMGMSRSNLHRKVKSISGTTVSQFICKIRLEKAMIQLTETPLSISEVAYSTGFQSVTYFTKCFKDQFGYPPGEFRKNKSTESAPHKLIKNKISLVWIFAALAVVMLAIVLILVFDPFAGNPYDQEKSIAVLPLRDDSPEGGNAYILNGLLEEIMDKLTAFEDLQVVSRTTVEQYRNSDKNLKEIGRELHVNYILEGSAQIIQGNSRIRLQLIEAATDKHLWSKPYEREVSLENIFDIQEEVSLAVASELNVLLASREKEQLEKIPTNNLAAYNLYLLGKDYLNIGLYSVNRDGNIQNTIKMIKSK